MTQQFQWHRCLDNPIFPAVPGTWMESQTANPVEKINGKYFMWYEGYGGGTARREPSETYLKGGKSQVGLAVLDAEYFYVKVMF